MADFSYVWTLAGFCYVAFVVDVFSRRILGWRVSTSKEASLVVDAFRQALQVRHRGEATWTATGLVHHGVAGSQGEFNWSSQHLDHGGVEWDDQGSRCRRRRPGHGGQWAADRALRPAMRSPGRPEPSRAVQREFWRLIGTGVTTVEASVAVGVSWPVGARWFRHAGGMSPISLDEPTGRY